MVGFGLGALVRQTMIEFELGSIKDGALDIVIWGKVIAAYVISVAAYKVIAGIILRNRQKTSESGNGDDRSV